MRYGHVGGIGSRLYIQWTYSHIVRANVYMYVRDMH